MRLCACAGVRAGPGTRGGRERAHPAAGTSTKGTRHAPTTRGREPRQKGAFPLRLPGVLLSFPKAARCMPLLPPKTASLSYGLKK
eukprot:scaffold21906_cov63-Phaeocystis_antarctica.AAC.1